MKNQLIMSCTPQNNLKNAESEFNRSWLLENRFVKSILCYMNISKTWIGFQHFHSYLIRTVRDHIPLYGNKGSQRKLLFQNKFIGRTWIQILILSTQINKGCYSISFEWAIQGFDIPWDKRAHNGRAVILSKWCNFRVKSTL